MKKAFPIIAIMLLVLLPICYYIIFLKQPSVVQHQPTPNVSMETTYQELQPQTIVTHIKKFFNETLSSIGSGFVALFFISILIPGIGQLVFLPLWLMLLTFWVQMIHWSIRYSKRLRAKIIWPIIIILIPFIGALVYYFVEGDSVRIKNNLKIISLGTSAFYGGRLFS